MTVPVVGVEMEEDTLDYPKGQLHSLPAIMLSGLMSVCTVIIVSVVDSHGNRLDSCYSFSFLRSNNNSF